MWTAAGPPAKAGGTFNCYEALPGYEERRSVVTSVGLAAVAGQHLVDNDPEMSAVENRDVYDMSLEGHHAAVYPLRWFRTGTSCSST